MSERTVSDAAQDLSKACDSQIKKLIGKGGAKFVTNPLDYAWDLHKQYLDIAQKGGAKTLMLGMNPGPWGMAQSGIPFGATAMAKKIGIKSVPLGEAKHHPKRPLVGLDLERQEVSGTRIWNILFENYGDVENIFQNVFLVNHCPLLILSETGANITPDKLPATSTAKLLDACDKHLIDVIRIKGIERVVGVGKYAEKRARKALGAGKTGTGQLDGRGIEIDTCWHPSPASPLANRNNGEDLKQNILSVLNKEW